MPRWLSTTLYQFITSLKCSGRCWLWEKGETDSTFLLTASYFLPRYNTGSSDYFMFVECRYWDACCLMYSQNVLVAVWDREIGMCSPSACQWLWISNSVSTSFNYHCIFWKNPLSKNSDIAKFELWGGAVRETWHFNSPVHLLLRGYSVSTSSMGLWAGQITYVCSLRYDEAFFSTTVFWHKEGNEIHKGVHACNIYRASICLAEILHKHKICFENM